MSVLLDTIKSDLHAGESWLVGEAEMVGLDLWNILKGAFVALEPAAAQILMDVLKAGVAAASAGSSIEQIQTQVLNTASTEALGAIRQAGTGVVQTIIAALRASGL